MKGRVTSLSQPHVLRAHILAADVRHGEEATVNVHGVEAIAWPEELQPSEVSLQFCNLDEVEVIARSGQADGRELPVRARVKGVDLPGEGLYDLLGFRLSLNGAMMLRPTRGSRIVARNPHRVRPAPIGA